MNCSGTMTRCEREAARPYRSATGSIVYLCDTCRAVGEAHGMSLTPVSEWVARAALNVLPGWVRTA